MAPPLMSWPVAPPPGPARATRLGLAPTRRGGQDVARDNRAGVADGTVDAQALGHRRGRDGGRGRACPRRSADGRGPIDESGPAEPSRDALRLRSAFGARPRRRLRSARSDPAGAGCPARRAALPVLSAVRGRWRGRRRSHSARRSLTGAEAQAICLLRSGEAASALRLSRIAAVRALSTRELAYMDALWALQAHVAGGQSIAVTVARQAQLCFRTSTALLLHRPAPDGGACLFATPGFSPARAATDDRGCARGPDLAVPVARGVPGPARGKVLPGTRVRSQVVHFPPKPYVPGPNPLIDHYPDGRLPVGPPEWRNLGAVRHRRSCGQRAPAPSSTPRVPGTASHSTSRTTARRR